MGLENRKNEVKLRPPRCRPLKHSTTPFGRPSRQSKPKKVWFASWFTKTGYFPEFGVFSPIRKSTKNRGFSQKWGFCEFSSEQKRHMNFQHINFCCRPSCPGLSQDCDRGNQLQGPEPRKIQNSSKVTQKWLSGGLPQSSSKVTSKVTFWPKKVTFESLFGSKSHFWGHFWATLRESPRKSLLSHFWAILNFSGFGAL